MSDNIYQTIEYQEQILDDLDDIKGSLDEESEYYDKEYQKKVLGSLRNIEKSLETNDLTVIPLYSEFNSFLKYGTGYNYGTNIPDGKFYLMSAGSYYYWRVYDVSDFDSVSFTSNGSCRVAFTDILPDVLISSSGLVDGTCTKFPEKTDYSFSDFSYDFMYLFYESSIYPTVYGHPVSSDVPEEPVEVVTTSSAVIIEGLDNLTQITTFQSFCSSLLVGILLFLVFVKGLRK